MSTAIERKVSLSSIFSQKITLFFFLHLSTQLGSFLVGCSSTSECNESKIGFYISQKSARRVNNRRYILASKSNERKNVWKFSIFSPKSKRGRIATMTILALRREFGSVSVCERYNCDRRISTIQLDFYDCVEPVGEVSHSGGARLRLPSCDR